MNQSVSKHQRWKGSQRPSNPNLPFTDAENESQRMKGNSSMLVTGMSLDTVCSTVEKNCMQNSNLDLPSS